MEKMIVPIVAALKELQQNDNLRDRIDALKSKSDNIHDNVLETQMMVGTIYNDWTEARAQISSVAGAVSEMVQIRKELAAISSAQQATALLRGSGGMDRAQLPLVGGEGNLADILNEYVESNARVTEMEVYEVIHDFILGFMYFPRHGPEDNPYFEGIS
jgi:hypothetical protein